VIVNTHSSTHSMNSIHKGKHLQTCEITAVRTEES